MEPIEFKKYDEEFSKGKYKEAFYILDKIIKNSSYSNQYKAEAYNLQGVCVSFDPNIDIENESGLFYFKQAILCDKKNLETHLNIVNGFGNSPNNHTDKNALFESINYLKSVHYEFDDIHLPDEVVKILKSGKK